MWRETKGKRNFKFMLFLIVVGCASTTGYLKGSEEINDWFAAAFGLLTLVLAGLVLKMSLDDREVLARFYYELGFRHGQETRVIQRASATHRGAQSRDSNP